MQAPPDSLPADDRPAPAGTTPAARALQWRVDRVRDEHREWLSIECTAAGHRPGRAWWTFGEGLRREIDVLIGAEDQWIAAGPTDEWSFDARVAHGLLALARANAACSAHDLTLSSWLGGHARDTVRVAWRLSVPAGSDADRATTLTRQLDRTRTAALTRGVTAFVVDDRSPDPDSIVRTVRRIRADLGDGARLTLQLDGQLDVDRARRLHRMLAATHLVCLADPCRSLDEAVEATHQALPALGLTADRYPRAALLDCLCRTPPTVLVVDPVLEGGPEAVRRLAGVARVLQVDLSLSAARGAGWLTHVCAALAAALPACHQPIALPECPAGEESALGIRDGALGHPFHLGDCHNGFASAPLDRDDGVSRGRP